MRAVIKVLKSIGITQQLRWSISNHNERIQQIKNKFKEHRQNLNSKQQSIKYFNDNYLNQLVEQNYCFSDIVDITNCIIFHQPNHKSDKQIMFIAYAYNLYYSQLKNGKLILESITNWLKAKIEKQQFNVEDKQAENNILSNIKFLTNRDNSFLEQQLTALKNVFFKFIALKSNIIDDKGKYRQITSETLFSLFGICSFIPKNLKNSHYLSQIQNMYTELVKFQCNQLLSKQDDLINEKSGSQEIQRFVILMEIGVIIGKVINKYIDIFQSLPTKFRNERIFVNYLNVIKNYFTYQLMKRIDYKKLDNYNYILSSRNKEYRGKQSIKKFQQYIQSLIRLKSNNLKMFDPYLFSP